MVKKILGPLAYIVFLACVFEGMARLAWQIPYVADRATDEDRCRNDWLLRHKDTGREIFYDFDIYDPTKGWTSRPNVRDRVAFGNKVLNTNSRSMRGRAEYSYGKNPDKVRILVLGDSFTFGDDVSDNETYCHYLQEMLPQVEVINMGTHGYGHDQMLIRLQEEGIKYEPDIVMLGFLSFDMSRNVLGFKDYAKPKFVLRNGALKLTGSPVPRPEFILKRQWVRSRAFELFSAVREKLEKRTGKYDDNVKKTTTAILTKMVAVTRSIGATPIFVYLPPGYEISEPGLTSGEKYLLSMCAANGNVKCFSARPYFAEKAKNGTTFNREGHWAPPGHLAAAEAIKAYLVAEGYVARPRAQN